MTRKKQPTCFHFFERIQDGDKPGGVTVTKHGELPRGDFAITEFCWGDVSLWFVDADNFSANERQAAYAEQAFVRRG